MRSDRPTARPPAHLSKRSRKFWRDTVDTFDLEQHHLELLRRACEAMDTADVAGEVLREKGTTFNNRFGEPRPRPEVAIERDSRVAIARLLRELGLDAPPTDARPPRVGGGR